MSHVRSWISPFLFTLILVLSLSSVVCAGPISNEGTEELYNEYEVTPNDPYEDYFVEWSIVSASPQITSDVALFIIYDQFPHLKYFQKPVIELMQFPTPSGLLNIYSYSWDAIPQLVIEQNADTGELLQYIDFAALENPITESGIPALSRTAASMLAQMRFEMVCDREMRSGYYPAAPEILVEDDGIYVFVWTKHYEGIPYYDEQFVIAIHPYTGMPILIVEQRDYSLIGRDQLPDHFLDEQQALELVRSYIDPVLVEITLSENQPQELVWLSGITVSAFLTDGSDLEYMPKETGIQPPSGQELLVDKNTALQRFSDSLSLELQWLNDSYYDQNLGVVSFLEPVYIIKFQPLQDSVVSVIPALTDEAEFISNVMEALK